MAISNETRKRLWGRSGNLCALCRKELVRSDTGELPGALVAEEAHIIARSPGGPRYVPLDPKVRDSYGNLILLCANDHREVDNQPIRYPIEKLQALKRRHEAWVRSRLRVDQATSEVTLSVMVLGTQVWALLEGSLAYQCDSPNDLTDQEADLVDDALQELVDWGQIEGDVAIHGFRAIRDAKRSIQAQLEALRDAGFVLFGGSYESVWGDITGKTTCLKVLKLADVIG